MYEDEPRVSFTNLCYEKFVIIDNDAIIIMHFNYAKF